VPGGRSTLAKLVERVRFLLDDPAGPNQRWDDNEICQALDANREDAYRIDARPVTQILGGGSAQWLRYDLPGTWWEDALTLRDSSGAAIPGTAYTFDAARGVVTFPSNTHGTAYYADGSSYDPESAAADLIEKLLTRYALAYDVSMDGQSFSRSQVVQNLTRRAQQLRSAGRVGSARLIRSDYPGPDTRAPRR
jgi:hypothetical protein